MSSVIGDILVIKDVNPHALSSAKFNQVCRCCLSEGQTMYPMFKLDFNGTSFTELLKRCSSVKIEENDRLPQKVCAICLKKVIELHSFKEQCSRSETVLKDVLNREYLKERSINYLNKITVPKDEIKIIDENSWEEFDLQNNYEEIVPENEYQENVSSVCMTDIDIAKEEVIGNAECEQNIDDIVLENAVIKKPRKTRIRKKITLKKAKPFKLITFPKISVKKPRKKCEQVELKCRVCKAVFSNKDDFREHRRKEKHPLRENVLCNVCGTFVVFGTSKEHMKTHAKLKLYECDICLRRFGTKVILKRHKMLHTNERPYKCNICEKAFVQKVTLQAHLRTHTGEKPLICHRCGKTFTRNINLWIHLRRVHEEEIGDGTEIQHKNIKRIFANVQCSICQKSFASKASMRLHLLTHGEKNVMCSQCDKRFYRECDLKMHQRVHTGEKPYQCTICLKWFTYLSCLKAHGKIHTGEKPHICKVCNRGFTQPGQLMYHMRTHSGERPYACKYCGKAFALNGNLTVHVRTHTGETPYLCDVCGKGFYDASSRKKHKQLHCIKD